MQVKKFVSLAVLASLAGCATLPTSGPTGGQIRKSVQTSPTDLPIQLVEVASVADVPAPAEEPIPALLRSELPPPPTDMIGPGDVLDITIYEAGITLFAGGAAPSVTMVGGDAKAGGGAITGGTGVQAQKLPLTRVDDNGDIVIPYAGKLHVVGSTTGEVEAMIRHSLRRLSQNPQVLVTQAQVITNSVIVGGEVAKPGRLVLQTNRETLTDAIALAGGYRGTAKDLMLRLIRHNQTVDIWLNDLIAKPALDVRAYPGDRLMLVDNPRTFSVLGAPGKVEQMPFVRSTISLAEAIAMAGGANPNAGDPAATFIFRYVTDANGKDVPVVYHLNMMKGGSYFLSQHFIMRDKDILYFGNAEANQASKMVQLISQFFTPFLSVAAVVNTVR
jgi:polysaccharide export outer membrane protein